MTFNQDHLSQNYNVFSQPATVATLAERIGLKNLTPEIDLNNRFIEENSVSRPSLQLAGFFNYYAYKRVQLFGLVEHEYIRTLSEEVLADRFQEITSYDVPCIIFARALPVCDTILEICRTNGVPALATSKITAEVDTEITNLLSFMLAPKETIHGELVDVYGVGVLICGDSGIGKSEAALSLINRGHRLVSDDVVEVRRVSEETLIGVSPELTRDFIELRGIGIINVRTMFGYEAVKPSQTIDMIINLEEYEQGKIYDRFGLEPQYEELMGVPLSRIDIPIRPGRNVAVIVESAAINYRARVMGYDAPSDFMSRIQKVKEDSIRFK